MRAHSGNRLTSRALYLAAAPSSISMMPQDYFCTKLDNLHLFREAWVSFSTMELLSTTKASKWEDTQPLYADHPRF